MTAKRRPTGRTIQVDRIISVGRDRETGGAVIRLKDADGRPTATSCHRMTDRGAGTESRKAASQVARQRWRRVDPAHKGV